MPHITTDDGCKIHVEVEGPQHAPVLMLSNSLGTDLHMWDEQVEPFTSISGWCATTAAATANPTCRRAPIRWSGSAATRSRCSTGSASKSSTGAACRWAAWSAVDRRQCAAPRRKVVLSNTSSYFPDKTGGTPASNGARKGPRGVVDANMERWLTKGFRERAAAR